MVTPVGLCKGCVNLSWDYVSKKLNKRDLENFPILFSEHSSQPNINHDLDIRLWNSGAGVTSVSQLDSVTSELQELWQSILLIDLQFNQAYEQGTDTTLL